MVGSHKVIGLRPAECCWEKKWTFPSWVDFFDNPSKYLEQIPEVERTNLHATIAKTVKKRELFSQDILVFDIDDIELDRIDDYVDVVAIGISDKGTRDNIAFVSSGHGLHAYCKLAQPIEDESDYKLQRKLYDFICKRIEVNLEDAGLIGRVDRNVFAPSHLIRLPKTINLKEGKEPREVEILSGLPRLEIDLLLEASSCNFLVDEDEYIHEASMKRMPPIEGDAVLDGCNFLEYCKYNQAEIIEPQWHTMLTIVARVDEKLAHEYSKEHPKYSFSKTELKIKQILDNQGPRTCDNICGLWEGCQDCEHFGNIISPITIKSSEYIYTEKTGFRKLNKKGDPGKLAYEDLVKFFERHHEYITVADERRVYIWENDFWKPIEDANLENFALKHVSPDPTGSERTEFMRRVKCTNLRVIEFFDTDKLLNVANGVLKIDTLELVPHSPEYGFKYKLKYDYDSEALAPRFDQFLNEVTQNRRELRNILEEYGGYCFSGICPSIGERAALLIGDGSNGKSVYLDTLFNLVPEEASCSLMLSDLGKEYNLDQLHGKLFNISEETPRKSLMDGSSFKNLITGGRVNARRPYGLPYTYVNKAKFIFACNELPRNLDATHGMMRRLLIIPFDARFGRHNRDPYLRDKLKAEASGILNIFISGFHRFMKQGEFSASDIVDKEVESYKTEADTIGSFFKDCITITSDDKDRVENKTLFREYIRWTNDEGCVRDAIHGRTGFIRGVNKLHPNITQNVKKVNKKSIRFTCGITLDMEKNIDF